jgi:hypothetical protein
VPDKGHRGGTKCCRGNSPLSRRETPAGRVPCEAAVGKLLARCGDGIHLNPHMEGEIGASIFRHACKLGLKGIVSKHRDGAYVGKAERNEWRRA